MILRPGGRASAFLIAAVAGAVLFQLMFGLSLVLAGHPFWIEPKGDMATMMAGFHALMDDRWRFPLTVTHRLRDFPVAVIYTDSLPWLALAFKALRLDGVLNPLGTFLLLSYVLQPMSMVALLHACGVRRLSTLLAGGFIALLAPVWLVRQFGHIALGGHFILLLALALSVAAARGGLSNSRIAGFAALAALSVGVHAYHVVPVFACLGAAALSETLQRGLPGLRRAGVALAVGLITAGLAAWVLGYGVGQGLSGGGGAMGIWSMNVLGPVLPQASALLGQDWNGAWFEQTLDPNRNQSFEGYAYLGAGIVFLLLAAVTLAAREKLKPVAGRATGSLRRFGPLIAAMACLTLWAIGPRAYVGPWLLFDIGRPEGRIGEWLGLFRAHGRFFWTAGYALAAFALTTVDRLGGRARLALLLAAVALQGFDLTQMQRGVRSTYEPYQAFYGEAGLLRSSPVFEGREWRLYPVIECTTGYNGLASTQISALAVRRHGTTNSGVTARGQFAACDPIPEDALRDAGPGDRRITVVFDEAGVLEHFKQRKDCWTFSRGLICGRGLAETGLPRWTNWIVREEIPFDTGRRPAILGRGWSIAEPGGIWTEGNLAILRLPPGMAPGTKAFAIELDASGYRTEGGSPQPVTVSINDDVLTRWQVLDGAYRVEVPERTDASQAIELVFDIPRAAAPQEADPRNPDSRRLGIAVRRLKVFY